MMLQQDVDMKLDQEHMYMMFATEEVCRFVNKAAIPIVRYEQCR
jgi:hypothetical protein